MLAHWMPLHPPGRLHGDSSGSSCFSLRQCDCTSSARLRLPRSHFPSRPIPATTLQPSLKIRPNAMSKPGSDSYGPAPGALKELRRRPIQVNVPLQAEPLGPIWTFPGVGSAHDVQAPRDEIDEIREKLSVKRHQLGEWPATAICGNDILSSVLYSSGIVTAKAGKLAPIPLLLVAVVLYFFRFIYEEVVTAIPLNGGSYNVLLNTTSKKVAAFGAALGIISYLATSVVSASSGVNYLISVAPGVPLVGSTIGLLALFALLNLWGITESSRVALAIFLHHVLVLTILSVASFVYVVQHTHVFNDNMNSKLPEVDFAGDKIQSNVFTAIFFGFGAAMLGITGFESSAQFVEEQKPGVFRKTLRNMWGSVTLFNTVLIFMALGVMPVDEIIKNKDFLLAEMGEIVLGHWFKVWVAIDAFVVLSGAVLTSYVGITGLVSRLSSDRVLPAFLMKKNKIRGTSHYIILAFFLVASSLVLVLNADTATLSGVYTYAFLGLMALFSFGCMVLKTKRAEIPRDIHAPWWSCIMGFVFVIIGIFANLLGDPKVLMYFALYLIVVVSVMMGMLNRVEILKIALAVMRSILPSRSRARSSENGSGPQSPVPDAYAAVNSPALEDRESTIRTGARGGRTITKAIIGINELPIIFFCKNPDLTILNKAILYVRKNEQTHNLRVIHVSPNTDDGESGDGVSIRTEFENIVALFDHIYPKLRIDFIHVQGEFEPAVVKWVSETLEVPINLMFIAQPGDKAVHSVSKLGVRVITG